MMFLLVLLFLLKGNSCPTYVAPIDNQVVTELIIELKPSYYNLIIIDVEPDGEQIGLPTGDTLPWDLDVYAYFYDQHGNPIIGELGIHYKNLMIVPLYANRNNRIARIKLRNMSGKFHLEYLELNCG